MDMKLLSLFCTSLVHQCTRNGQICTPPLTLNNKEKCWGAGEMLAPPFKDILSKLMSFFCTSLVHQCTGI